MIRTCIVILLLGLNSSLTFCQDQEWINYINDQYIYDLAFEGSKVWVCTDGGPICIDRVTHEMEYFLPNNSGIRGVGVYSIEIDDKGCKWIGGEGGLFAFDGSSWDRFHILQTGDTLYRTENIRISPNNEIWFRSFVRGNCGECYKLFRYDGLEFKDMTNYFAIGTRGSSVGIYDVDSEGGFWGIGSDTVFHYLNDQISIYHDEFELGDTSKLRNLVWHEDYGTIVVSRKVSIDDHETAIYRYSDNSWKIMPVEGENILRTYADVLKDSNNDLWVIYSDENSNDVYLKLNDGNWDRWERSDLGNIPTSGWQNPVFLDVDSLGHWWTQYGSDVNSHLLYEFDQLKWSSYDTEIYPLPNNLVDALLIDCDNNVWFASGSNIIKFDGISWQHFSSFDLGISTYFGTWSMTLDTSTCEIWIALYDNNDDSPGYIKYDGDTFSKFYTPTNRDVFKVLIGPNGTRWVASFGDGLGRIDDDGTTWYNSSNSPLEGTVTDITLDKDGNIWAGYLHGIAYFNGNNWINYDSSNSGAPEWLLWIFIDSFGNLWTSEGLPGSYHNVIRFDGANWESLNITSPLGYVQSMVQDQFQNYWFGTSEGVFKYNGMDFSHYNLSNSKITGNSTSEIHVDNYGNKWFVHSAGVSVFNENGISNHIIAPPNKMEGNVFFDSNKDGIFQPNTEYGISGEKIRLLPDSLITYSTFGGYFAFHPEQGQYELLIDLTNNYIPTSPTSLNAIVQNSNISGLNFGIWTNSPFDSISVDVTSGFIRCFDTTSLWINLTNHGILPADGNIELKFNDGFDYIESNIVPDNIQGNVISWDYYDLIPYEYRPIHILLGNPNIDSVSYEYCFEVNATRFVDNGPDYITTDISCDSLRCAYDPNDKTAIPLGEIQDNLSLIGDPIEYTIRFQNKGNDTAFIVIIRDTLDSLLDPSSFKLISHSHPLRVEISNENILTFYFEEINLLWESINENSSQGFVKYRISSYAAIPDYSVIENAADIIFDFNPPIRTNTTKNIVVESFPSTSVESNYLEDPDVLIYPNPSVGDFMVDIQLNHKFLDKEIDVCIYDIIGNVILRQKYFDSRFQIRNLAQGIYILTIEINEHLVTKKLISLD